MPAASMAADGFRFAVIAAVLLAWRESLRLALA
jgi:hypothetical protein